MKKILSTLAIVGVAGAFAAPSLAANKTVKVADDVFKPKTMTVSKGTTVLFRWTGDNPHNVVVTSGPAKFRSDTKVSGTYKRKLKKKGTYRIVCTIHSNMKMTLKVR